jgi:endonuclease-3 related protein
MNKVDEIYSIMAASYGKQGWWPVFNNVTGRSEYGTGAPKNDEERFEIVIGAILTQNVAWKNVEKGLEILKKNKILTPRKLHKADNELIAFCIRPTGYFNQKTLKIKNFLNWFKGFNYSFDKLKSIKTPVLRDSFLEINGVGPETADSILLYALNRKIFVIDAYTKRIFSRLNIVLPDDSYDSIQKLFHKEFNGTVKKYNEYHALIVAHGKDICRNKPLCPECCLNHICCYKPD